MNNSIEKKILLSAPHMSGNELKYIEKAFDDNFIVPLGPNVDAFENNMIQYLQEDRCYAVAMSSGTAAIHIALRLLEVKPGEEIFCASSTFIATANPIMYEKAIPVFIDSEEESWNLCPKALLKAIEDKKKTGKIPRILLAVDLFGTSAKYDEIAKICNENNIQLIADAAESLGATYKNKKCGTFGRFGIFSFNGNKIITTSGGGMLITHNKEEAQHAIKLITQARENAPYYLHKEVGFNYRMSNVCAGIGLGQLEVLQDRVAARRLHFENYKKKLASTPLIFNDNDTEDTKSNRWLSTALINPKSKYQPSDLLKYLADHNIEGRHVWKPLHSQPLFSNNEFYKVSDESISEKIFNHGICLPSCSSMTVDEHDRVTKVILSFFEQ
ncbi:aminotransferase class I/II-fold pyridoxal phosphate-dependent enzyme [Halobacteriovorax sp. RZ-3]|uniref:aminotransferase class I/II-fold pyridoxal phosphate-dependent enzyme n=1 Tax=Halobacteriovorax sp. RZ-3 TaxID=3157720 RepID=UPI00370FCC60